MKKIAKMLLMLACVFGLTACGSAETVSEYQQSKIENAQAHATFIIDNVTELVKNGTGAEWLEKYNNVELAEVFTSRLSENFYNKTKKPFPFYAEGKGVRSALSSFESGLETIGTIKKQEESTAVVDGDTIVVTVPITGEKASGSVELIFTNDIYMKMTSCTLNLNETMGQLMTRAALNTLLGMGTVFVVLILISLIISAFGLIPKIQASFSKKEEPVVTPSVSATPAAAKTEEPEDLTDDLELVAVIAAAIAAYEGTSADGFQVRSIRRANTSKWKKA